MGINHNKIPAFHKKWVGGIMCLYLSLNERAVGWHFSLASMYWAVFSVLFIGSDLWLHHKISRLIALSILALAYLMSFEYYLFCDEYRFVVHQGSSGKIFLADIGKFHEYWFYQGLLVTYLLLTIGVSHLLRRKKLLTNRDNA